MKVAIIGSRDYPNLGAVIQMVETLKMQYSELMIISGGARGVDSVAESTAKFNSIPTKIFPAEWDKYGKSAGFRRNADIVKASDMVIAFWDGKSRGTKHSIDLAKGMEKIVMIVYPKDMK